MRLFKRTSILMKVDLFEAYMYSLNILILCNLMITTGIYNTLTSPEPIEVYGFLLITITKVCTLLRNIYPSSCCKFLIFYFLMSLEIKAQSLFNSAMCFPLKLFKINNTEENEKKLQKSHNILLSQNFSRS